MPTSNNLLTVTNYLPICIVATYCGITIETVSLLGLLWKNTVENFRYINVNCKQNKNTQKYNQALQ